MRLLVFGDLHLDSAFAWARPESARQRRQALRDTLQAVLSLAEEVDAAAVLCTGDLYEQERFTPDTREFLRGALAAVARRVIIAPGNHDWFGPQSLYAQVEWSDNVHIFTDDRFVPLALAPGVTLWGAGHLAPRNVPGFFDGGFHVAGEGIHLGLFHGAERAGLPFELGGKEPHAPFDADQVSAAGLLHAFVGHYHQPRDEPRFTYPGNPEPLTFGERGDRGAVVVDLAEDGTLSRRRVKVSRSAVHDLQFDVTGCTSLQEVRGRLVEQLEGLDGSARVTVEGELAPEVDLVLADLEQVESSLSELVVRVGAMSVAYDVERIAAEPTIRGQFVQEVQAATDLEEDERRKILTTGLRALAGRQDLEVE